MISPYQKELAFVPDFVSKQQKKSFDTVESSVNIISEKEVAYVRRFSSNFEKLKQVIKLPMNVSTDRDGRWNLETVFFLNQDFLSFLAQLFNLNLLNILLVL